MQTYVGKGVIARWNRRLGQNRERIEESLEGALDLDGSAAAVEEICRHPGGQFARLELPVEVGDDGPLEVRVYFLDPRQRRARMDAGQTMEDRDRNAPRRNSSGQAVVALRPQPDPAS